MEKGNRMERIQKILAHPEYRECVRLIGEWEKDRKFCRHDYVHFLNVARLAMILKLKEDLTIPQEEIYAAALLHDVARHIQYETGEDHAAASSRLARSILLDAGFGEKETCVIIDAIRNHRNKDIEKEKNLRGILYRADKLSRECYVCEMESECNWKDEKKNRELLL